jgi:hypothetical protein
MRDLALWAQEVEGPHVKKISVRDFTDVEGEGDQGHATDDR